MHLRASGAKIEGEGYRKSKLLDLVWWIFREPKSKTDALKMDWGDNIL